jgi:uncharacterized repeat protein (TIGR01451 family)
MSKQKTMTPAAIMSRPRWLALSCVVAGVCLLTAGPAVASPPTPAWGIIATSQPTNFAPGEPASYLIKITNVGSGPTDGSDVTVTDTLPNGLTPTSCQGLSSCAISGQTVTWIHTGVFEPGQIADLDTRVEVAPTVEGTVTNTVAVSGGGTPTVTITEPTTIGSALPFGTASFSAPAIDPDGTPDTQAGGHPYSLTTNIAFNTTGTTLEQSPDFLGDPSTISGDVKDIQVDPPLGLIGNPQATPMCTQDQFREQICPPSSQVGVSRIDFSGHACSCAAVGPLSTAVYNMVPPTGVPAQFAFAYDVGGVHVRTRLNARVHTGGDYGLTVATSGVAQEQSTPLLDNTVTLWGVPADPSHDDQRCKFLSYENGLCIGTPGTNGGPNPAGVPLKPFLTMPTACPGTPLRTSLEADSWQEPGNFVPGEATQAAVEGCGKLPFEPGLEAQPTSTLADSPSGLNVDLHVPQPEGCKEEGGKVECELAEAELRDATVTLPAGMAVNPSEAGGLEACSEAQIGYLPQRSAEVGHPQFTPAPAECPDASKVGTVEVDSPLVDHPLPGAVYVAAQDANPFKSLLALYITVYDPQSGVVVKLPGKVALDPVTGQLTTTVDEDPQLPFNDFKLDFFGGSRGALTTPLVCASYAIGSDLTPWSAPEGADATPSSLPFAVTGPGGGACVGSEGQAPNSPSFTAGTASPVAGSYSPFVLKLSREDGSQRFGALNVTLPPGLTGKIAGIEQCPQAAIEKVQSRGHEGEGALEQSNPSCPSGSAVGVVHVGAGSGAPYYVTGKAYFAGPYNGAPFSLVIVAPAVAGPFDLGTVVVRAGLFINPSTAQVTVKSDPFPTILDGIPLDIRTIGVEINRHEFTLNPTSCNVMAVTGGETSTAGQTASLSSRFQAGGCTTLPFHPVFGVSTNGITSRKEGASLLVNVGSSMGQANIRKLDVSLPLALPSRLTTLQKACAEAQFAANPAGCPAASNVGIATARTPVLNVPLSGPAYLVSHGGAAFPDLVIVLQGEGITIDLTGNTDIKKGITFSRFETVPDAPISSFELNLPEGPHSVLAANGNLCTPTKSVIVRKRVALRRHGRTVHVVRRVTQLVAAPLEMPTTITGQNGAVVTQSTKIAVTGCPKVVKKALTRAQKLKAALKVCRTKDKGKSKAKRHKREACEKAAKQKYGSVKKAKGGGKKAKRK